MNGITIGYNPETGSFVTSEFEKELNLNDEERQIVDHFIQAIRKSSPAAPLSIEQRSSDYVSLCTGLNDFLRIKSTPRARWISVDVLGLNVSPEDPRFAAQKKKTVRFWRADLHDLSDLNSFDDVVVASCVNNMNR